MRFASGLLTLLAILGLVSACDYIDPKNGAAAPPPSNAGTGGVPGSGGTGGGGPTAAATATFQQVYSQILAPKCVTCHSGSTNPNLSAWASFARDTRYVLPGNPGQSDIYVQTSSGSMPKNSTALTQTELTLLYNWIEQGALNN